MSTPARKRLMRDFKRLQQDPPAGISGAPQDNNIMLWNAIIFGLDGGTFKLTLQFSEDYPHKPPIVRFVSRIFHPNNGSICSDILQNQWSPIYDVAAILTSIQAHFAQVNAPGAMNPPMLALPGYRLQRHGQPGQRRMGFRRGGMPQQMQQQAPRSPIPIAALASALASAPPEQQRVMLGNQLYPLVEQIERDHAGKVTGMLLEMDQTEVLHLVESPDALRKKVGEAMEVLRLAHATAADAVDQLASLSLNH